MAHTAACQQGGDCDIVSSFPFGELLKSNPAGSWSLCRLTLSERCCSVMAPTQAHFHLCFRHHEHTWPAILLETGFMGKRNGRHVARAAAGAWSRVLEHDAAHANRCWARIQGALCCRFVLELYFSCADESYQSISTKRGGDLFLPAENYP